MLDCVLNHVCHKSLIQYVEKERTKKEQQKKQKQDKDMKAE